MTKRRGFTRRFGRIGLSVVVALSTALVSVLLAPVASAAGTGQVDLKVLLVTAGDSSEDVARELMVRTLDKMGVPYDVLDSKRADLTSAQLYLDPAHGKYNGIVLTVSDLYQAGGGSGFTLAEWQLLHQYERDFGVREAVVSGFPTWDPSLDLDYGMGIVGAVGSSSAQWQAPAGGTELFEYVNTANPLDVTAFAFTGTPRNDGIAPAVTPLLTDPGSGATLVSKLTYADGRQTLLSSISNAWYFLHSYVLAYEFINFATNGLFIGSRQSYLSVHTDDLFIEDELWNPATNMPYPDQSYRMTPADVATTVTNQNAFRADHPLASGYVTQFPFNGYGAGDGTQIVPPETYTATGDAELRQYTCLFNICANVATRNYGGSASAAVNRTTARELSRYAVRFENQLALGDPTIVKAELKLTAATLTTAVSRQARACRATEDWTEGTGTGGSTQTTNVSWARRTGTTNWATAGGSFDATNCVTFALRYNGLTTVDITPIFQRWRDGAPDYGVIVMATGTSNTSLGLRTKEASTGKPQLTLTFPTTVADPLTAAMVANKSQFGFVNHTYASRQMDRVCPEVTPQPVLCDVTSYLTVKNEIARNRSVWTKLGLPDYAAGTTYLLSDSHAGLHDRRSTEENPDDDIPYPAGKNNNFFQAMQDLGVGYVASDSSRPGQDAEAFAPGYNVFTSPRYPSAIFVNSSTPAENTDQYNWIFHDRYVAMGVDPCTVLAAICTPRTWQQILDAEADLTMLHMVSGSMWPHYMHQINLRAYDGVHQLQFDWLNAVMSRYERNIKLPVVSLRAWDIGPIQKRLANARTQQVRGTLDIATGVVTLVANGAAQPTVTGLAGGSLYGGQRQLVSAVSTAPTTYAVDPALNV